MMSHSNGKQALQAHQFNEFSNPMSPLPATPLTPTRIIQQLICQEALSLLITE